MAPSTVLHSLIGFNISSKQCLIDQSEGEQS